MQITVQSVTADEHLTVECTTPVGDLVASWRGSQPPVAGQTYDVEVDTIGPIVWGEQLTVDSQPDAADRHEVNGTIEAIEGDVLTLRVGGSLLVLEVSGDGQPAELLGLSVRVRPVGFTVWPTGI